MADHPETGRRPSPSTPALPSGALQPIGGRPPRFGVARELELMQTASAPSPLGPTTTPPPTAGRWDRLRTWWACRESTPIDAWHRLLCRFGRHDVRGGQRVQVGGRYVNTQRCCVRCRVTPSL